MSVVTVWETKDVELYTDKNGKYWLWDKRDECNKAIRADTEIQAYREAIHMYSFSLTLVKDGRRKAEEGLEKLEKCFKEVFEIEEQEDW